MTRQIIFLDNFRNSTISRRNYYFQNYSKKNNIDWDFNKILTMIVISTGVSLSSNLKWKILKVQMAILFLKTFLQKIYLKFLKFID